MATRAEDKARYYPDNSVQRRTLEDALRATRARWFQLEQERKARLRTLAAAKKGKSDVPAVAFMETAAEQLKSAIEVRVAQVLSELQQFEAEIDTHMEALAALPEDEDDTNQAPGD